MIPILPQKKPFIPTCEAKYCWSGGESEGVFFSLSLYSIVGCGEGREGGRGIIRDVYVWKLFDKWLTAIMNHIVHTSILTIVQSKIWSSTRKRAIWSSDGRFLVDDDIWSIDIIGMWDYYVTVSFYFCTWNWWNGV